MTDSPQLIKKYQCPWCGALISEGVLDNFLKWENGDYSPDREDCNVVTTCPNCKNQCSIEE